MSLPQLVLKTGKEASVLRKHPWIFSGAIHKVILHDNQELTEGQIVDVLDAHERFLGRGHFGEESIACRILAFEPVEFDQNFWNNKLKQALAMRKALGLYLNTSTNCFRLVHGEGDGLPGLIIDIYDKVAIVQAHSYGMYKAKEQICEGLQNIFNGTLKAVYNKSQKTLPARFHVQDGYLYKEEELKVPVKVLENDLQFEVNWVDGQKTGFFIDQRESRKLLADYAKGKKILNTFCYSGGFSIYALAAGATQVDSVDSSTKAIDLVNNNVDLNFSNAAHKSYVSDTLSFLKASEEKYDIIVLDPPAYAKNLKSKHKAVQGYKRLNIEGLKRLKPGGLLFTYSCSQVIHRKLFEDTITAAAIQSKRNIKILHHLSQASDHPVSIYHPEGAYLKGLVLYVE